MSGVELVATMFGCNCGHQWWSKVAQPKRCPKCHRVRQTKTQKAIAAALHEERKWWHQNWHRDTGIPCDGTMEVCRRAHP